MTPVPRRREVLSGLAGALMLGACTTPAMSPSAQTLVPVLKSKTQWPVIIFVHGNGDSASIWQTTLWRFESNGWPVDHLHAIDMPYPLARDDDTVAQPGRSSITQYTDFLASEVSRLLATTGARQVVLMGNSRGGYPIRNYINNGGGAARVSHAILCGTPNHGVWAIPGYREGSEFAGTGTFLKGLNAPKNAQGDEVIGPVKWLTIRSDGNDKFAQSDGVWIGRKGQPTFVTANGPELKGANNVVIDRIDHRETAFSAAAFAAAHAFILGQPAATLAITPQDIVLLDGKITSLGLAPLDPSSGNFANNLPLPGAHLDIYASDANTGARAGPAVHSVSVGSGGRWGPFRASAGAAYEFVISAPGYAITHIYRSPFARSSQLIHLRAERLPDADKDAKAWVTLSRPRGYFDAQRDTMRFDGQSPPPGLPSSGAGISTSKIKLSNDVQRPIAAEFNGERITGQTWSVEQGHLVFLELTF